MRARLGVLVAGVAGAAVAGYVIVHVGFAETVDAVLAVGVIGFLLICLYGLLTFVVLGAAWLVLVPGAKLGDLHRFVVGRLVRDSVAELLPFSQLGGFLAGGRAIRALGYSSAMASASTIADVTTEMIAQIAYLVLGIAILVVALPATGQNVSLVIALLTVTGIALAAATGFVAVQRHGIGWLERTVARMFPSAAGRAAAMTQAMETVHHSPSRILLSFAIHCAAWIATGVGTWIMIRLIGGHTRVEAVLALESILYAVRSMAFAVPSGLGVQELTYVTLAPLFGMPPEVALAVSVLKRGRDIAIGAPTLLLWQAIESNHQIAKDADAIAGGQSQ